MGEVNNLQSGQSFQVVQKKVKSPVPEHMTIAETAGFNQKTAKEQSEIAAIKNNFKDRYSENGKVELIVEDAQGVAVIEGKNIDLSELSQKGQALARYALELKKYDENGDNHITEDELYTSWGERLGGAGIAIGGSTVAAAGTGASIGAMGGTAVVPGIGTVAGGGALGLLGGAIGFVGSFIWEGGKTAVYAARDKYDSPSWSR
ncbi:MAG TPA: hypothetical protein V6D23_24965 [Candidatus Obscuribacterales bacterium]